MREFNITGVCVPNMHYMVDVTNKIEEVKKLVFQGKYFTINKARQFGKTTIINQLYHSVKNSYLVIKISFEGLGEKAFSSEKEFCKSFMNLVTEELSFELINKDIICLWEKNISESDKFEDLSKKITTLVTNVDKEIILIIDEVDKSSDNQLFLHFLGMLRNKYLRRNEGRDKTFKSVILAGVYDVKNLKIKLLPDVEKKYNSPWNIAANFTVDLSFNPDEIASMLVDYSCSTKIEIDINLISEKIYKFTSGYPFLVSAICKLIDEHLDKDWSEIGIQKAINILVGSKNTLFDEVIKNLQNNEDLYNTVCRIVLKGESFDQNTYADETGLMFGILGIDTKGKLKVHNEIFEILIYNYLVAKRDREKGVLLTYEYRTNFIDDNGNLDMEIVLLKFQEMMKAEYRDKDADCIEREGRLLFIAFLRPIINGRGFYFVEPQTRQDNRMDVVVTYNKKKFIVELKIWRGKKYEENGLAQLWEYLDSQNEQEGYMVFYNFNSNKEYLKEWIEVEGKRIYQVMV